MLKFDTKRNNFEMKQSDQFLKFFVPIKKKKKILSYHRDFSFVEYVTTGLTIIIIKKKQKKYYITFYAFIWLHGW